LGLADAGRVLRCRDVRVVVGGCEGTKAWVVRRLVAASSTKGRSRRRRCWRMSGAKEEAVIVGVLACV
jgi:hypothetical protein